MRGGLLRHINDTSSFIQELSNKVLLHHGSDSRLEKIFDKCNGATFIVIPYK